MNIASDPFCEKWKQAKSWERKVTPSVLQAFDDATSDVHYNPQRRDTLK
jgi:hypothetical protein